MGIWGSAATPNSCCRANIFLVGSIGLILGYDHAVFSTTSYWKLTETAFEIFLDPRDAAADTEQPRFHSQFETLVLCMLSRIAYHIDCVLPIGILL